MGKNVFGLLYIILLPWFYTESLYIPFFSVPVQTATSLCQNLYRVRKKKRLKKSGLKKPEKKGSKKEKEEKRA